MMFVSLLTEKKTPLQIKNQFFLRTENREMEVNVVDFTEDESKNGTKRGD